METVEIVSAGTMGQGIAQICAQADLEVTLRDVDDTATTPTGGQLGRLNLPFAYIDR